MGSWVFFMIVMRWMSWFILGWGGSVYGWMVPGCDTFCVLCGGKTCFQVLLASGCELSIVDGFCSALISSSNLCGDVYK